MKNWLPQLVSLILNTTTSIILSFDANDNLAEQVEALNIKEIAYVRKKGFAYRLTFADLLRRYCFLGFSFDERVTASRENAQLLMLRNMFKFMQDVKLLHFTVTKTF